MPSEEQLSIRHLEEQLSTHPDSLAFSRLADCHRKQGDIPRAIAICKDGIRRHPDYVTGRIILGRCYLEQGDLKEAISEFVNVCRSDRRNLLSLKMMADVFSKQGMEEKAGNLYACLLTLDPHNHSLRRLSADFRGSGKTDVFDILGIDVRQDQETSPSPAPVNRQAPTRQPDAVPPPEDAGAPSVTADEEKMEDLPGESASFTDASIDEISKELGDDLTGDDVSKRMSEMFLDELPAAAPVVAEQVDELPAVTSQVPPDRKQQRIFDSIENAETMAIPGSMLTDEEAAPVAGDLASRVAELFGEAPPEGEVLLTQESEPAAPSPIRGAPKADIDKKAEETGRISGEDVRSRLAEMFGEEAAGSQAAPAEAPPEGAVEEIPAPADVAPADAASSATDLEDDLFAAEPAETGAAVDQASTAALDWTPNKGGVAADDLMDVLSVETAAGVPSDLFAVDEDGDVDIRASVAPEAPAAEDELFATDWGDDQESAADAVLTDELTDKMPSGDEVAGQLQSLLAEPETAQPVAGEISDESTQGPLPMAAPAEAVAGKPAPLPSPEDTGRIQSSDVTRRLDEMFAQDLLSPEPLKESVIPEEDGGPGPGRGFYNIAGDDVEAAGTHGLLLDDLDEVEIGTPLEEPLDTVSSLETAAMTQDETAEREPLDIADEIIDDTAQTPEAVEGEDVAKRLDEIFSDAPLDAQEPAALMLEDAEDEPTLKQDFYTLTGDGAEAAPAQDEILEKLGGLEFDACATERFDRSSLESIAREGEETIALPASSGPQAQTPEDTDRGGETQAIPDHVLTPTLADIYYQQGQTDLAIKIYERLTQRDPDNEKLRQRLDQIRAARQAELDEPSTAQAESASSPDAAEPSPGAQPKRTRTPKPLKGVKIPRANRDKLRKRGSPS